MQRFLVEGLKGQTLHCNPIYLTFDIYYETISVTCDINYTCKL